MKGLPRNQMPFLPSKAQYETRNENATRWESLLSRILAAWCIASGYRFDLLIGAAIS